MLGTFAPGIGSAFLTAAMQRNLIHYRDTLMFRKCLALVLVLFCGAAIAAAQDFQTAVETPSLFSPTYFKQAFLKPNRYTVEAPAPLRDMVQDGKLTLSIQDVARLVVQRNTDVWLARFDVQSAQTAIVRA